MGLRATRTGGSPLLGPGRWRISLAAGPSETLVHDASDVAHVTAEDHVLILTPLDARARAWRTPQAADPGDASLRESASEVYFIRAGRGAWMLTWSGQPAALPVGVSNSGLPVEGQRVVAVDDGVLMRFGQRSELTVLVHGRSYYEHGYEKLLGERWAAQAELPVPAGKAVTLLNFKGAPARGVPDPITTGPASVVVAVRRPDTYDFVHLDSGETVRSYDRDTDAAEDVTVLILLS